MGFDVRVGDTWRLSPIGREGKKKRRDSKAGDDECTRDRRLEGRNEVI